MAQGGEVPETIVYIEHDDRAGTIRPDAKKGARVQRIGLYSGSPLQTACIKSRLDSNALNGSVGG